jgi:hypothetical protein
MAETKEDRGYVEQECSTCHKRGTSSTINRGQAETYDPRCTKCGTDTMTMVRWVQEATEESLRERVKSLEEELHAAYVSLQEAEAKAAAADVIVLPVSKGIAGEIDVFTDGHSHHYVPASALDWEDVDDEWSQAIKAAHPIHTESHETYATAMKMVGHRHSKGQLVALANWLLIEREKKRSYEPTDPIEEGIRRSQRGKE